MMFEVGKLTYKLFDVGGKRSVYLDVVCSLSLFTFLSPLMPIYKNSEPHAGGPYCSARYLICGLSGRQPYVLISLQLFFHADIFSNPPLEYSLPRSILSFSSGFQLDFSHCKRRWSLEGRMMIRC